MSETTDFVAIVRELGPAFAARTADHDAADTFVGDNYKALKERGASSRPASPPSWAAAAPPTRSCAR